MKIVFGASSEFFAKRFRCVEILNVVCALFIFFIH